MEAWFIFSTSAGHTGNQCKHSSPTLSLPPSLSSLFQCGESMQILCAVDEEGMAVSDFLSVLSILYCKQSVLSLLAVLLADAAVMPTFYFD